MSNPRQSVAVTREYKHERDDCARALELLLKPSFNSQSSKGGSHDLTHNRTTETVKNGSRIKEQEKT